MMDSLSCRECTFFEDHVVNHGKTDDDAGLCRFSPPIAQPKPDAPGLWPVVSAEDWCGHFEKEEK